MKEKNKSKFYVKVLIVITIIACILSGIFFILQNNTELIQEVDEIASKKATEVIYINTESDLITFRNNVNSGNNRNATVYLTSNIAIDSEWKPISNFGGKFDGLGHTISGIQNDENDYGGLFGTTSGAEIRNVKIDDTTIAEIGGGGFTYGALINIANNTKIYNCCVQYSTIRSNGIAGGIVGEANSSQISKCYNNQSAVNSGIESVDGAGGIAGRAENTTIEYCYNRGQVKALSPGGIVGGALPRRGVTIKYCYNVGSVQFSASVMDNDVSYPGAISCVSDDTITNCYFLAGTGTAYGAATSKTDSQLKNSTIISSLGGTSIWKMGTTSSYYYPVLLWQVDSTGPKVNLEYNYNFDNPPIISELSMTINASDTESGLDDLNEYEYCFSKSDKSLAGVRWQKYTPGQNMTIYPDVSGDYYIIIKQVYDNAGNIGKIANGSNIYSSAGTTTIGGREYIIAPGKPIKFDVEGPDIWITSNSFYFKTPTQVTIKATDDVEIKIAQYKIDTGSWQDIGGDTKELTETITISKTCTVYLEVTDTAGATNSCSYNFIVDSTPPTITGFEDGQWHNTEITATANDENIDTDQLRYYYSASYIASVNFDQLIPTKSKSKKFSEEGYYFVGACDKVGNQSKIYSFKIEKTKASIVNVVKKPEDWTSGDVTITVTLSDVLSGYEYIQPRNDDEDYRESVKSDSIKINGNVCEFTVTENGTYVISAKTKSGFSQLDLEEVAVVDKIDKTYPTDNEPSVTATTDTITVTRNNQTDTGSGIETSKTQYGYRKKNEANANYTWGNSATISGLQDDTEYEVVTKSTDKVGHTTTSRPATIRTESADKNPPTISAKPENQNTYVKSVNVVLTIDEEVKEGELQYIWTTSNSNTAPGGSWSVTTIKNKTATVSKTDSNGIYYLWVGQVTDNHGNTSDKKRFGPYYLDVTGPQFKVTRTPNGWTTEDVTLKIIDVTDNGKIANTDPYQFGSDGWTSSTTKVYHENAGSINVYVRDEAGNIGTYNIAVTNIDRTPPTITEAKNTATGYTKDKTTLSGKAQDTLSGINGWQFSKENNITKDSNGWQTINATTESITQTQEISENGTWYFYVKDQAGNVRKSSAITVDKIEKASDVKIPKITGKVGNNDYASNSWTNQTVTLTVNGTASSGVSGYKYQKNGIGGWIDCDGAKKDTLTISEAGTTKIKAKTVSNTGLESGESQEFTVNIDRTAPTCTITAVPDPGESNWTNSENITYTFEFSETVTGFTENSIQVSKGTKGTFNTVEKDKKYTLIVKNVNNEEYTQTVTVAANAVRDRAQNGNAQATKSIKVDRKIPTITASPANQNTYVTSQQVNLTASENVKDAKLQYKWTQDEKNVPNSWNEETIQNKKTASVTATGLTGTYYLWVGPVTDEHGNKSTATHFGPYKFDNTKPTKPKITGMVGSSSYTSGTWTNQDRVDLTISGSTALSGIKEYKYNTNNGEQWNSYKPGITTELYINQKGTTTIKAKAISNTNLESDESDVFTVRIDKTLPTNTEPSILEVTTKSIKIQCQQTDNGSENSGLKSSETQYGIRKKDSNSSYTWNSNGVFDSLDDDTDYEVVTKVTDNAGNTNTSTAKIVKTKKLQIATLILKKNNVSGDNYTQNTWTNTDVYVALSGENISLSTYKSKDGSAQNVGQTNGVTTVKQEGTTTLEVTTTDGHNTKNATYIILIDKTLPTCTITSNPDPANSGWTNSETITYTFEFSENVTGFTIDKINVSQGTQGTLTPVIEGKKYTLAVTNANNAEYTQTVTVAQDAVRDRAQNGNAQVTKSIKVDRKAPNIVSVTGNPSAWQKTDVTLTVTANDGNGSGIPTANAYSFDGGKTWESNTSKTFGTNQDVTIKVKDNVGNEASTTVKIEKIDKELPDNTAPTIDTTTTNSIKIINKQKDVGGSGIKTIEYGIYKDNKWVWQAEDTFTGLTHNTQYKFKTRVTDNATNQRESNEVTGKTVELKAGTLSFKKGKATGDDYTEGTWTNQDIYVILNNGTQGSGVTTTYKSVEDSIQSVGETNSPVTINKEGTTKLQVTTKDGTNTVTSKVYEIKIDITAPKITVVENDAWYNTSSVTVQGVDQGGSGFAANNLKYKMSTTAFSAQPQLKDMTGIGTVRGQNTISADLTQEGHYYVAAIDVAGNVSDFVKFGIDRTPPTFIVTGNATTWTSGDVTLQVTNINDGNGSGLADENAYCFDDVWQSENSKTFGENKTVSIKIKDNAGNESEIKYEIINKIDKANPNDTRPNASSTTKSITVTNHQQDQASSEDIKSGIKTIEYAIKKTSDTNWGSYVNEGTNEEHTFDNLDHNTSYDVKTKVTDNAGNVQESKVTTISTKELIAGRLNFKLDNDEGQDYTPDTWTNHSVYVTMTGGNAGNSTYTNSDNAGGQRITETANPTTISQEGITKLKVTTTDGYNTVYSQEYIIKIDKTAPTDTAPKTSNPTTNGVTVTNKQTDNGDSGLDDSKTEYGIRKKGSDEEYKWSKDGTFNDLEDDTTYEVVTKVTDNAGNTVQSNPTDVHTEKLEIATLNLYKGNNESGLEYTQNTWTNTDVYVTLTSKNSATNYYNSKHGSAQNVDKTSGATTVNKEGTTTLQVTTTDGHNFKTAEYVIKIDKTKPVISGVRNDAWYTTKNVVVQGIDQGGSNFAENALRWQVKSSQFTEKPNIDSMTKGGKLNNANNNISTDLYDEGYYYVAAVDIAGNVSDYVKFGIDRTAPEFTVSGNSNNWTKNDITLTVTATDTLSGIPTTLGYSFDESWQDENSKTFSINKNIPITVKDVAGNVAVVKTENITKIDKAEPTNEEPTTSKTTHSITVTNRQQDQGTIGGSPSGIAKIEFAIKKSSDDNWGEWKTNTNAISETYTFDGLLHNTEYKVKTKVTDNAGNEKESAETTVNTTELKAGSLTLRKTNENGEIYNSGEWTNTDVYVTLNKENGTTNSYASTYGQNVASRSEAITIDQEGTTKLKVTTSDGINTVYSDEYVINIDKEVPTCIITATPNADLINNSETIYTFTFSEEVVGFDINDVILTGGTKGIFKNENIEGKLANTKYTLVVNNPNDREFEQKVEINAGACRDRAGNICTKASKTINVDRKRPTCVITAENVQNYITNSDTTTYKFTFSEDVKDFGKEDINITSGTKGEFKEISKNEYTLVINNTNEKEEYQTVSINDNVCTDNAGNANIGAKTEAVKIDKKRPTCVITTYEKDPTAADSIIYNIVFSETVKNLNQSDITVENGIVTTFMGSGSIYYIVVTGGNTGLQTVSINNNVCQDSAENGNIESTKSINIDKSAPIVDNISKSTEEWTNGNVTLTINGAEDVGTAGLADAPYSFDGGNTWTNQNSKVYTANQNNINIKVKDKLENIYSTTEKIENIDKTEATVTLTANINTWTNGEVKLTATAVDEQSKIEYYMFSTNSNLDEIQDKWQKIEPNTRITKEYTINEQTTGIKTWYFYVKNEAGIVSRTSTLVYLDHTAPIVSLSSQGDAEYKKTHNVEITISDEGIGTIGKNSRLEYGWSKSNTVEPEQLKQALVQGNKAIAEGEGLSGKYYLWIKAGIEDGVGNSTNKDVVSTSTFYFDNMMPEVIIKPDGQENSDVTSYTKTKDIEVLIKDSKSIKSNNIEYCFTENSQQKPDNWTSVPITKNGETGIANLKNIGSELTGIYYLWIKEGIEDSLGNATTFPTVSKYPFYFDNIVPTLSLTQTVGDKEITVEVTASDENSGLANENTYKYYIGTDKNNYVLKETTKNSTYTFTGLSEGTKYYIKVEVADNAGNISTVTNEQLTTVKVSKITVEPTLKDIKVGDTVELVAKVIPDNAQNYELAWTSSNSEIATVDGNGTVTGIKEGSVTITCSADEENKATSTIVVKPREVSNEITISNPSWEDGYASVIITNGSSENTIEYSINKKEGPYTKLETSTLNNLKHGDTVYARESDGTYNSAVVSKQIVDSISPILEVSGNVSDWQKEKVTLRIHSLDMQSGLKEVRVNNEVVQIDNNYATYTVLINGNNEIVAEDNAGNVVRLNEIVSYIDNVKPTINVTKEPEEETKDGVTLNIKALDNESGINSILVNNKEITNTNGTCQFVATENGKYTITVTDNAGNITTYTETVDNIDNVAPALTVEYTKDSSLNTVTVTVNANEKIRVVNGWKLSKDKMSLTKTFLSNQTQTITVYDLVGNSTEQKIKVSIIDDKKLEVEDVTYTPNTLTNDKVTVTVILNKPVLPVNGWNMSNEGKTLTKEFYNNYQNRVTFEDYSGNIVSTVINVNKIDKNKPVVRVEYSKTYITNENVTVTITANEEINEVDGWHLSDDSRTLTKTYETNDTEDVVITDKVGNTTVQTVTVENIDKAVPTADVMYSISTKTNGSVDVTIKASEEIEPVTDWTLSDNGTTLKRTYANNANQEVTITDLAGNTAKVNVSISNIDNKAPNAKITYEPDTATNNLVKAIITVEEQVLDIDGWELTTENNISTLTKTYYENTIQNVIVEDLAGNTSLITVNIDKIDKVAPKLVISYNTDKPTNSPVTVTITADEDVLDIENWIKSNDNRTLTRQYEDNISENVTVKDAVGNEAIAEIDISNIDKEKPTAKVTYSTKDITNDAVTVQIHANEKLKEMEDWTLLQDGETLEREYLENATETVTITDLAGNTQDVQIDIKNIDKIAPNVESIIYTPNKEILTNKNVVVTITLNEAVKEIKDWTLSNENKTLTKEYSLNMEEDITITDIAGNETIAHINVTNIDKEELAAEVSYSTQSPTNKAVTATIRANKKLKDTNDDWEYQENDMILTKTYEENTEEKVLLEDLAGNTKEVKIEINNIDKDAPKGEVTYSTDKPTNQIVKVKVRANEPLKAVSGWELAEDGFILTKDYSNNVTDEKLIITDLAGNTAEVTINIRNIDTEAPKIEKIEYSPSTPTNDTVEVTITVSEEVDDVLGWELSEDKRHLTKEYSKNTKEDVIVTDKAGNTTKAEVNVTNIEKQELEAIVTYDIEDWTNKNVTATITANKPLKPQDDEWQLSENKMELTKTFDKNYLGNVEIESEAGNKKQVEVKIENIDKMEPTKPTLDVVYAEEGENNWYTSDEVIVKVTGGIDLDSGVLKTTYVVEKQEEENQKEEIIIRSGNSFTISGEGVYKVKAFTYDKAGNKAQIKEELEVKIDTEAPINLEFKEIEVKPNRFTMQATAEDWPSNIQSYDFYLNGEKVQSSLQTQYSLTGLKQNTKYEIYVIVRDFAGHETKSENTITITTPMVPSGGDDTEVQPNPDDPTKPAKPDVTPVDPDTVDPSEDIDGDGNPDGTPGSNYNIKATPVTWENEEASTTLSIVEKYRADFYIEYQINGPEEDGWTKGEEGSVTEEGIKITKLHHNDIIYARLTDGENYGPYIAYIVKDKVAPEKFDITVDNITTDGFMVKGGTVDLESGIERYEYYLNDSLIATIKVDEEQEKIQPEEREYSVTGLMQNETYNVKVVAIDRAQNKTEAILKEPVMTKGIPSGGEIVDPGEGTDPDDPNKPIDPDSPDNPFGQDDKYKPDPENPNKPTRPEYTIGWSIEVAPAVWENEKASITLSTKTEFAIEYQIDDTNDDGWVTGENIGKEGIKVTGLSHGSIVYARLTDGTNYGDYIAVIVLDEKAPESFTVTIENVTTDGFIVKGGTVDLESGMERYEYYLNDSLIATIKVDEEQEKIEPDEREYSVTGLMQNETYNVKVVAIDKAQNKTEAILKEPVITKEIPGGEVVDPDTPIDPNDPNKPIDPESPDNPFGQDDKYKPDPEDSHKPTRPEYTIGWSIEVAPAVWENEQASITLSTKTDFAIEYQIDATNDDGWVTGENITKEGTKVTGLSHGSIVYARLTDGTNHGDYIAVIVLDEISPNAPTISVVEGNEVEKDVYEGITKVKIEEGKDSQTGTIKTKYTINGEEIETKEDVTLTLTKNGEYKIEAYSIDKAGNTSKKIEKKITVQAIANDYFYSDIYDIEEENLYITKVKPHTDYAEFKKHIFTNLDYIVVREKDEKAEDIKEEELIKTGDILKVKDKEYRLIVTGDIDKDGECAISDLSRLKRLIIQEVELEDIQERAADVNYDKDANISDLSKIVKYIIGMIKF